MPLLFYLPLIVWMGLFEVAQDECRSPSTARPDNDRPPNAFGQERPACGLIATPRINPQPPAVVLIATWYFQLTDPQCNLMAEGER
jgi:hypothetical protein